MSYYPSQLSSSARQNLQGVQPLLKKVLKRKGWIITGGFLAILLVAAIVTYKTHWWIGAATSPIRVTVSSGCPSSLTDHNGVRNAGLGFWFEMVPGSPTSAIVCDYPPLPGLPVSQVVLTGAAAQRLSAAADASSTDRPQAGCAWTESNIAVVAFSYPGRGDVDLWYDFGNCGTLTNGRLESENATIFGSLVQQDVARATSAVIP